MLLKYTQYIRNNVLLVFCLKHNVNSIQLLICYARDIVRIGRDYFIAIGNTQVRLGHIDKGSAVNCLVDW